MKVMKIKRAELDMADILIFTHLFITLVSSCALARLSTAMAKKTFSKVSVHSLVKDVMDNKATPKTRIQTETVLEQKTFQKSAKQNANGRELF